MAYRKRWLKAIKLADIGIFSFHGLMCTAISYLVMNGASIHVAGEVLGHKPVETNKRHTLLSVGHKMVLADKPPGNAMEELL